ncbi:uncharacterized protein LOC113752031 [Coffea eugenioides]|uniref:uncharacterized protein LOC113752031 n=1 Tax=Coffea eugenioides TaxID=49369 RepID=UPI000F60DE49|nr:uncharacterized protein LOC113752031 [Coffea eugenioides]
MDSYGELEDRSEVKERKPGETPGTLMGAKMAELQKRKEKLTTAKDKAVQSWSDSRPVIDELEKLQSELADAQSRTASSNVTISELDSQLERLSISFRAKKEEELKIRTMINRINQVLQQTQEEMEEFKMERDEKHRTGLKLKQVLRLRWQTLRTLQLTLRAIRLESEAYAASALEAQRYISLFQTDDTMVKLTQEEYHALTKRARDDTSLAEWRIAVSMEQKRAAEESQETAARRLQNLYSKNGSRKRKHPANGVINQHTAAEGEEQEQNLKARFHSRNGQNSLPKVQVNLQAKSSQRQPQQSFKISRSKNSYLSKKKKSSTFCRIRTFVVKIKRYFR